ncbi:hypothetical protein OA92_23160 [Marinomonas sp. SBI22]|uniref:hypothetical protein n=1 Tax=unclassified Marinomonas TaxID=196814 RepID=UPI0007AEFE60|nr:MULTISPECIES: hypothetical protein [unclassified Marinomonas]KZM38564.1 hypothetical protein OA92_23160 [Marinomonas sp. SBI22]KZM41949.1 hypothetical protein OA91_15990 [Marinomonas sp. SBI8L]
MSNILSVYYKAYGGFGALLKSYYLYGSFFISIALFPHWSASGWWDDVLSIMPNLLGFSLGGYAMFLAIGDEKFRSLIAGDDGDEDGASPFLSLNGAFVHFIVLQVVALFIALFRKAYDFSLPLDHPFVEFFNGYFHDMIIVGNFIGYWVFIYALSLTLAATFALLRVGRWYDIYQTDKNK